MSLFIVLTRGRTGSSPLVSDINQHPEIVCHQELFSSWPESLPDDLAPSYESLKREGHVHSLQSYLDETISVAPARLTGFKILMQHFDERKDLGLEQFVFQSRMPIIFLTRDPLRAAISAGIAKERKAFNRHAKETNREYIERFKKKVTLSSTYIVNEIKYYAYWQDSWRKKLSDIDAPHIEVTYEEYVINRIHLLNRIYNYLGVSEMQRLDAPLYARVTSEDVWDDIVNADEIRQALGLVSS